MGIYIYIYIYTFTVDIVGLFGFIFRRLFNKYHLRILSIFYYYAILYNCYIYIDYIYICFNNNKYNKCLQTEYSQKKYENSIYGRVFVSRRYSVFNTEISSSGLYNTYVYIHIYNISNNDAFIVPSLHSITHGMDINA